MKKRQRKFITHLIKLEGNVQLRIKACFQSSKQKGMAHFWSSYVKITGIAWLIIYWCLLTVCCSIIMYCKANI